MTYFRTGIWIFLLMSCCARAAEVSNQSSIVSTIAEVSVSGLTNVVFRDEDSFQSQVIGNQVLGCSSQTNYQTLSLSTSSTLTFTKTNNLGAEVYLMQTDLVMQSVGDLEVLNTYARMRGFVTSTVSFDLRSDTPCRYSVAVSNQPPPASRNYGGIIIRTSNGSPVLAMDWDSMVGGSPQGHMDLAAGAYQVQLWTFAEAEGDASLQIKNPIAGKVGTALALTITPLVPPEPAAPVIRLRRGEGEKVVLEMSGLQPAKTYYIERSQDLLPGTWLIVAGFYAGSTNATWVDSVDHNVGMNFYRVRY